MPLTVFYITNNPDVALIAESVGVDRIWVDLETLGKVERQRGINSVKSYHTVHDIEVIAPLLTKAEMMVRINPWNEHSPKEVDQVVKAGAQIVMLPMWRSVSEVTDFIKAVDGRAKVSLLLETKEADGCLDEVLNLDGIDEIHIGLNDLHLSYGLSFMFELLANGTVERIINKIRAKGIPCGFGGVSHIGDGIIPAEMIVMEHYRLGSTRAILSRGFCDQTKSLDEISRSFKSRMDELREFEKRIDPTRLDANREEIVKRIKTIVEKINHA